jgi:HAD superfamily hydrolase (TIGR01509 family)
MTETAAPAAAPPAAVLWDMDGTLVDTEPYWMASEHELVDSFGGTWTDEDAKSIIGFDLLDAAVVIRERGGVDLEPEEIVERLLDGVVARVRENVPWRPGARRLLSELNAMGVPCALVTMSWARLVDAIVEALAPITFQAVVTGDAVEHGKPHPEPYQLAAERLGVDPVQCVAIEDSPPGVESATAAGCVVVAVPNIVPIEPAPRRFIVPTLKAIEPGDLGHMVATTPMEPAAPSQPERRSIGRRTLALVVAAIALVAVIVALALRRDDDAATPQPAQPPIPVAVHAWTPYWALEEALPDLAARAPTMAQLSPFWWVATGPESIEVQPNTPSAEAEQFLATSRDLGVPLVASILDGTAPGVMAGILADPDQRSRHVDTIAAFADDGDFHGIDIDYEQFAFADGRDTWPATRPNWVAFVEELAERLHADGRVLTVSIPPVYDAGQTEQSGFWVYDYAAITPHVDAIRVMAYDYSVPSGDPGPIAPLDWVERVIAGTTAASGDATKLVLGVPLYGYNWPVATTGTCPETAEGVTSVTNRTVADLAARRGATPQFDPVTSEWSFTYDLVVDDGTTSCTQRREVHYVDDDGAQVRMQLAIDAGFSGVALFAFGYDDADTWTAVDTVAASVGGG